VTAEVRATESERSVSFRDQAILVGVNLLWGFNLVANKAGVKELPPFLFSSLRLGLLALILSPLLRVHRGQMKNIFMAATLSGAATFGLVTLGIAISADVSTVAVASQLSVPFTTLLSVVMLGEVIRWRRILGITLAFAGVMVIGFDPHVLSYWPGFLCVVLSSLASALGLIYIKRLKGIRSLEIQAWLASVGAPILFVVSILLESQRWHTVPQAHWQAWGGLLYTTIASSLIAHSVLFYLISRYPVSSVSPFTLLSPIFSIMFGVTLLHDHLTPRMMLGSAVTLIGVLIVAVRDRRIVDTGS
jgi:O-acetylserine/cysteine efflux transporter